MGIVHIKGIVRNIKDERKKSELEFLVDSGAQYTLLPKDVVKNLNLKPTREQEFILGDGQLVKRKIGEAYVEIQGEKQPTTVILGEKDDSALLGAVTLEQMGLILDPFNRQLRPMKAILMQLLEAAENEPKLTIIEGGKLVKAMTATTVYSGHHLEKKVERVPTHHVASYVMEEKPVDSEGGAIIYEHVR